MKKIAILGASGSIGSNAIEVLIRHIDEYDLVAFSVYNNFDCIPFILSKFKNVEVVGVKSLDDVKSLISKYPKVSFVSGQEGLVRVATSSCDVVISSLVGFVGLTPTIKAIQCGKHIALANKETLVAAGEIVMKEAKKHGVSIVPIDSEHSAIFQCLDNFNKPRKIILTASGGPFKDKSIEELENVTLKEALNHPNWKMGNKITIDSATMFNKAFEIIEAHYLFNIPGDKIEVLIHPQSLVHSFVEYEDGALMAQMGVADMKLAIAYSMSYPKRLDNIADSLDLSSCCALEFNKPNKYQSKVLSLAYKALAIKGTYPAVLNAANEVAVDMFIKEKIRFLDIYDIVIKTLSAHTNIAGELTLEKIYEADSWARQYARRIVNG